jgi:amidase
MLSRWRVAVILAVLACLQIARAVSSQPAAAPVTFPDLYEASILELQEGLDAGHFSSVDLVKVCIERLSAQSE